MPITIDFSEFFKSLPDGPDTLDANVKDHFAYLQSEGLLGEYEVVTFLHNYVYGGPLMPGIITALKALIPAEGKRTLKEVIFSYPYPDYSNPEGHSVEKDCPVQSDMANQEGGSLEIGCFHLTSTEKHPVNAADCYSVSSHQLPKIDIVGILQSLSPLMNQITIQELVVEFSLKVKPSMVDLPDYLKVRCGGHRDVPSSIWEALRKTWFVFYSGSDRRMARMGVSLKGNLHIVKEIQSYDHASLPGGPQCIMQHPPDRSIPPDGHSTFVSITHSGCSYYEYKLECEAMQYLKLEQVHDKGSKGKGVAVAVLSSGCNNNAPQNVVGKKNFINQYNPVHDAGYHNAMSIGTCLSLAVVDMAPESKLIVCKTTFGEDDGYKAPHGATAKAMTWLRKKWSDKGWKEKHGLHSLVVLIPYGGHYREDEMIAINEAIDDGIIVVCAAGNTFAQWAGMQQIGLPTFTANMEYHPGIAFPASMGNVLCVGESDQGGHPANSSPSGREIDCLAPKHYKSSRYLHEQVILHGTGASASVLVGFVSLLLSYIHTLFEHDQHPPVINHVSIIREILQQTISRNPQGGCGRIMPNVFHFSKEKMKRLLSAITRERKYHEPPGLGNNVTEQCQFNTKVLSNRNLNQELDLGVILSGSGLRIAVIDDDFPQVLKTAHKPLEYIMEGPLFMFKEHSTLLKKTALSLKQITCSSVSSMKEAVEEQARLLEKEADHFTALGDQAITIEGNSFVLDEQHGLQCALIIANILPEVELRLVNSTGTATSESENLAQTIQQLVSLDPSERPDIIVSSMGFDQFNSCLSKAINKAINIGIIPVFSAGNIGHTETNSIAYPSRLGNVLCIGAHTSYGQAQEFSSVGREVNFLAPGEFMILDRCPVSGTSFSAPAAAAFIALILEYVDKIQDGTVNVSVEYKFVEVWKNKQWEEIPVNKACRNVYVMRELLCQMSLNRTGHAQTTGYGNLDIRRLLRDIGPEDIHDIVQNFHKPT